MMTKKYILGGGIAGLIWAFYNDGFVISPEFGGQMNSLFPLGPRYLHKNEYSIKFLQDLKINLNSRIIKVGYDTGAEVVSKIPDIKFMQKYYMKSRGKSNCEGFDDTVMNSSKSEFEVFEVSFDEIIEKLICILKDRLIQETIAKIDIDSKIIYTDKNQYEYSELINTIPLNIFTKLIQSKFILFPDASEFKYEPITYVWLKPDCKNNVFDYVYTCNEKDVYHRITFDIKGKILDWFGQHSVEECKSLFGKGFIDAKTIYNSQIIPTEKKINLPNVKFIGRYGTWNRHWKTEKVIEEALKTKENSQRISWDEYFIDLVQLIAKRSTCLKKQFGCIIVDGDNHIVGAGYNGSPKEMPHCTEVGCLIHEGHCIRTIHAEQNALLQAGKEAKGATLYCNGIPCPICFKLCIQAGIKKIVYIEPYREDETKYWIDNSNIEVIKYG